jgi:hypothetical protein
MLKRFCSCVLVVALMSSSLVSGAEAGSVFTARRTFGVLFLGGSALMAKKAIDFKRDADDIFEAYRLARNAENASQLFDRASDRDTKSQMSVGLSAILLVSGLRLLLDSGLDNNIPKIDRRIKIDVSSDVHQKKVGLALKRRF